MQRDRVAALRAKYGSRQAAAEDAHTTPKPLLSARDLVGLTFFAVCGGDYGIEDAVGAAGPAWTLIGLLVVPWLWSLPIALMTAELGSMIPDMGGPVVWVERAFGPFIAHQNAFVHLVANFFDNALYPVMFADYLREFHPALELDGLPRYLLSSGMLACITLLNLAGVDAVASVSTLFTVLVISPFAAFCLVGLPAVDPSAWLIGPPPPAAALADKGEASGGAPLLAAASAAAAPHVRWSTFLAVLLWNTSGYDSVGALAGEVEDPGRDFPRAMVASIVLITAVYVVPVAVGVSLDSPSELPSWTDGTFGRVASEHVGVWLARWISLGGAISALGLLNTLLCAAARIVVSTAEIGALPKALAAVHAPSGVPRAATLALAAGLLLVISLPFAALVEVSMLFYGVTTGLEFLALVRLRSLEPLTPRPYRVPLRDGLPLTLFCLAPILLCALLVAVADATSLAAFGGALALGGVTFCLRDDRRTQEQEPPPAAAPLL